MGFLDSLLKRVGLRRDKPAETRQYNRYGLITDSGIDMTMIEPVANIAPIASRASRTSLFAALNTARAKFGKPPLESDTLLDQVAGDWADRLAERGELSHGNMIDRIWSVHPGVAGAETIAAGQLTDDAVVSAWLSDPAHCEIIMGEWGAVGIGMATGPDGVVYWVADFDGSVE